ncbi:glycine betaine ABC transporter substrate-binding protein [Schumannella sp. 10F1B-5-1]|uniref:glycine betaine ABC transporter substrate-binding protein n=1 Tax=Schumannella sp. 10F1B-5-1 TaxID=2590780 RepID=UPI001132031C|nr:glycine betaine ABC transporter substrate-binding protein [Schumannella sp. 10F1B-5-1]TPW70100.1 glycine betaine ABC transporter substrate-binding protein [Schumannella sp. 10F1B-5-1]
MTTSRLRRGIALAAAASVALGLAACSSGSDDAGSDGDLGTITLGYIPSWTDGLSTAYLLQDQLEKIGYDVEMKELTEAAPLYTGLANGDVDIYPSAWPEVTHAAYMKKYGDDIEDLDTYYDNAKLTIAVPSYTDIDSIDELAGNAKKFDGKIYGIEPGAGLTGVTKDSMMPEYGLDGDYELVTSSTAAMLTELQKAIDDKKDIVVTLWTPFWANSSFDVKTLKDPKGAMGESEGLHFLATKGFSDEFPEAADYIKNIKLDDDQYGSLEDTVVNQYDKGEEADAIDAWLAKNPKAYTGILED